MWCGKRVVTIVISGAAVPATQGCKDACDSTLIERALAFVDAHQACETDDDCVIVGDFCEQLPGGYCGQLPMNRSGATSAEWEELTRELSDCSPDACSVCGAALVPACESGFCRRPR